MTGVHDVKAIGDDVTIYDIKALTAGGDRLDVKGLELSTEGVELIVNGVPVHAHVKALPQVGTPWRAAAARSAERAALRSSVDSGVRAAVKPRG